jgi:ATP-dependent Clp protease adaptor protein ClpS
MNSNKTYGPRFSDEEGESGVVTAKRIKTKRPKRYKVLLHNDDYTTMEFVIFVLQRFFGKSMEEAQGIMLKVHTEGVGVCGVFTYEIAETKQVQVNRAAEESGHPLKCSIEAE